MKKALKLIFYAGVAVIVALFFLSITGIIENNRGNSFGWGYRTHYVSFLFTMAIIYLVLNDGWLTWVGELGLICLDGYILWLNGKSVFVCFSLLIFMVFWRHYRRNGGTPFVDRQEYGLLFLMFRLLYLPVAVIDSIVDRFSFRRFKIVLTNLMVLSYPICFIINLILVFSYHKLASFWDSFTVLSTFRDRFVYALIGFREFPVNLFGNAISEYGGDESEVFKAIFFYLDSGYIKVLLDYGIVPFILMFGFATFVQVWNYKKEDIISLTAFSLFAVDCIIEYQAANWVLILAFTIVNRCCCVKSDMSRCGRLSLKDLSRGKRYLLALVATIILTAVALWCMTAYQISSWRGWTPAYDATVVIPGDYMRTDNDLVIEAANYLNTHSDSVCIVNNEKDKDLLLTQGIDDSRIYAVTACSIDEMLMQSYEMIEDNDLPHRLTLCAYNMQQERLSRHARELHIPINSISVKPESLYYVTFTAEQWRLLCGD